MRMGPVPRYLLRSAVLPLIVACVGAAAILGPWSALALDGANARWVAGDARGAFEAYTAVAEGWYAPATRAAAAERAGLLALAVGDAANGARWLRRAVDLEPEPARRAALRVQLADVYLERFGDAVRAADTLAQAAREGDPGPTWLAAARAYERGGAFESCASAYAEAVSALPDGAARTDAAAGASRCDVRAASAPTRSTDDAAP